jgi:hypothetical protein
LAHFENDWATADIVKQYLRNRRKYMARQSRQVTQGSKPDQVLNARNANVGRLDGGEAGNESA